MDDATFDALLRNAARTSSRHAVVRVGFRALAASLLTTLGLRAVDHAAAKKRKKKKKKCAKSGQTPSKKRKKCCKGLSKNAIGRCAKPCVCQPAGACRYDAVQAAVDDAAPGATLTLCAGVFTETIVINKNLTLIGTGDGAGPGNTILDGAGAGTVVRIEVESTVTLQNLRLTGGFNKFSVGGGIVNIGTVALTGCTITGNTAAQGGGISTHGTATFTDCAIFGNEATSSWGGGIDNTGTVELINSTVTGNTSSGDGGGIFNNGGTVTLEASSVTGNRADDSVGGIYNRVRAVSCSSDSKVNDNTAGSPPVESNCIDVDGGTGCATCPD